jgi:hypothetical protein
MKVTARHTYAHPIDEVFTSFTNADLITRRLTDAGASNVKVLQNSVLGDRAIIKTERVVASEIPAALKRIAGATNTLVQSENWSRQADGSRTCQLNIEVKGVPVTMRGTMRLAPTADGCANEIAIDINSSIPFLGGQLVKFSAEGAQQSLAGEYRAIQAILG